MIGSRGDISTSQMGNDNEGKRPFPIRDTSHVEKILRSNSFQFPLSKGGCRIIKPGPLIVDPMQPPWHPPFGLGFPSPNNQHNRQQNQLNQLYLLYSYGFQFYQKTAIFYHLIESITLLFSFQSVFKNYKENLLWAIFPQFTAVLLFKIVLSVLTNFQIFWYILIIFWDFCFNGFPL